MSIKFECPFIACMEKDRECDVCPHSIMILSGKARIDFEDSVFRDHLLWSVDQIDFFRRLAGHYSYREDDSDSITWNTLTALLMYMGSFEEITLFDFRDIEAYLKIIHRYDRTYHLSKNIPKDFLIKSMPKEEIYSYELHRSIPVSFARYRIEENKNKLFEKLMKNG